MAKKQTWQYGKSPNPKTWAETSDILKSLQSKPKKSSGIYERLLAIEGMLKEKK